MKNFWKGKRVFITGANGFLGGHLTERLLSFGIKPVVLIYEFLEGAPFYSKKLDAQVTQVHGDIRNLDLLLKILREHNIDSVFHLAAQAIVDQAIDDPLNTFEVNIQGTWNILEAAKIYGKLERMIVASSDKAYGHHENLPYGEATHSLKGAYSYEVSKACADLISQSYWRTFHLPICITRSANFYGPGDLKFNRIVPTTIRNIHFNQPPIIRDTGESLRDYLYIDDIVEGYLSLAQAMNNKIFGHAFNFGTNRPLSVLEVINIISREMGKKIEPVIVKTRGFEIRHQYVSHDKAWHILGWQPKTYFPEGIKKTIPWYIDHLNSIKKDERIVKGVSK